MNSKSTKTDLSMDLLSMQESVLQDQVIEMSTLKQKLLALSIRFESIENNNYKTKYYTGFKYFFTLKSVYDLIEPIITYIDQRML